MYATRSQKGFVDGSLRLDESVDLIKMLTDQCIGTTIIIDALDECDATTRHELLTSLTSIMQSASSVKIFVSSRDDKDITLRLQGQPNLHIRASDNDEDIRRYVKFEVGKAVADKRLLDGEVSTEMVQHIIQTLTMKAQGM
jgi:hypothetical protein